MSAHLRSLGRGFNWLGGAAVVARVVDVATTFLMLLLLTKSQVGTASLVISIGMVVEAFNGLGTGDALIQARTVSRLQLDTLFWYVVGAALGVAALVVLAAPALAAIYSASGWSAYFLAIAAKQPLVGAAVIPLAIMNRRLRYERIALVNVCATVAAAATRLALGMAGAGAWALVAGFAASGLYILIGATVAQPFRPRWRFSLVATRSLMRFGVRSTIANFSEQVGKNIDFLLVGWFYGAASLAIYRVAFDVAMEPAMAVGTIVNRAALPVFARVAAVRSALTQTLAWALRRIAILVAPLMAALVLAAWPLTALLHDHDGHSYAAAAFPLALLAVAAPLRLIVQLLGVVMVGSGMPANAARLSTATLLLLSVGILAMGGIFPASSGLVAVSAVWLGAYPILLGWALLVLHRSLGISPGAILRAFVVPSLGAGALVVVVLGSRSISSAQGNVVRMGIVSVGLVLLYACLFALNRRKGGAPTRAPLRASP